MKYKSHAQWPEGVYISKYGDNTSTDVHESHEAARQVLLTLEREGFGCEGKCFPIRTWISKIDNELSDRESFND